MGNDDNTRRLRPRFEIRTVDDTGDETVRIYSVPEFARNLEQVGMGRRGFLKLSLAAQAAALLLAAPGARAQNNDKRVDRTYTGVLGTIMLADHASDVLCLDPASGNDLICMKIIPLKDRKKRPISRFDRTIRLDEPAVFLRPRAELPVKYPVAIMGKITGLDVENRIVCAKDSVHGEETCVTLAPPDYADERRFAHVLSGLRVGDTAVLYEDFTIRDYEDIPMSLRAVYLKRGGVIECHESWLENDMLHYRLGFGTMAIALSEVDLQRSFKESVQIETEEAVARNASDMGRRAEARARQRAAEAKRALEEKKKAAEEARRAQRQGSQDSGPKGKYQTRGIEGESEDCGKVTDECSCVPVCY